MSTKLAAITVLVMGIMFSVPTVIIFLHTIIFRIRCKVAKGRLVRIEHNKDEEGNIMINPIYEFLNQRGEKIQLKRGIGYGLRYIPDVGSEVKIYYRENNPQKAQVASRGLWEILSVFFAVGGFLLFLAYILNTTSRGF